MTPNEKKSQQLGMPFSTASNILRQTIFFELVKETKKNFCFKCTKEIISQKELSIEHKKDWLDDDTDLFWSLENIAFSHRKCNKPGVPSNKKFVKDGQAWCSDHRKYIDIGNFYKSKNHWNGLDVRCKDCQFKNRQRIDYKKRHSLENKRYLEKVALIA